MKTMPHRKSEKICRANYTHVEDRRNVLIIRPAAYMDESLLTSLVIRH